MDRRNRDILKTSHRRRLLNEWGDAPPIPYARFKGDPAFWAACWRHVVMFRIRRSTIPSGPRKGQVVSDKLRVDRPGTLALGSVCERLLWLREQGEDYAYIETDYQTFPELHVRDDEVPQESEWYGIRDGIRRRIQK